MDFYEFLKTVHVLGAMVWIGGSFMLQLLFLRVRPDGGDRLAGFMSDTSALGNRTFIPASLLLVITGFAMIGDQDLEYQAWIVFGIAVWALSFVNGAFFLGPESGRLGQLIEAEGPDTAEAQSRIGRVIWFARVELLLLILVAIAMVVKAGA